MPLLEVVNFNKELSTAICYPRLHHQLYPNYIRVEDNFPEYCREGLKKKGHVQENPSSAIVQGIIRSGDSIHATSDSRKGGKPDGF